MYRIGEFSRLAQVSAKTLRHYDRLGLLTPERDPASGYRVYAPAQLRRLTRILALKDLGLSLDEIRPLLDDELQPPELRALLEEKRDELSVRVREDARRLARVESRLRELGGAPSYGPEDVAIKRVAALRVASLFAVLPTYAYVQELHEELGDRLRRAGVDLDSAYPRLTVYHDGKYVERDVHVEAARALAHDVRIGRGVRVRELAEVPSMASTVHEGPYSTLSGTFGRLVEWIHAHGYRITGQERSVYYGPVGPSTYATEVQFPVERP